jgi:hypothetical protein
MMEATASCLPRIGDYNTKRQAIKDKLTCAALQRILDDLAFCVFGWAMGEGRRGLLGRDVLES